MKTSSTIAAASLAALALALTACTGSPAPTASSASPTADLDPVVTLTDEVGARADLTEFTCAPNEGGTWDVAGVVTNSTKDKATYVVNIGIIDKDTRSSYVRKNVMLDVAAGESAKISETGLAEGVAETGAECVVRVNRGTGVEK